MLAGIDKIRFDSNYFLDGLKLESSSCAVFKLQQPLKNHSVLQAHS